VFEASFNLLAMLIARLSIHRIKSRETGLFSDMAPK